MQKAKTKSAAKKRFHINSAGTIKRAHKNKNHILNKKTRKRKRNLRKTAYVSKADTQNVKRMLGIGG